MTAGVDGVPDPVRLVVVEDHEAVRLGVRAALEGVPDVDVVGETGDAVEAVELAAGADVVLMDLGLGEGRLAGVQAVARIHQRHPLVRVLVYSQQEPRHVLAAIEAGAHGFVPKGAPLGELLAAVRAVRSAPVLPPEVAALVVERLQHPRAEALGLTDRQVEVLVRVAQGWQNDEIARGLDIDLRTVNRHLENIRARLQIRGRGDLARWAREHGLD